MVMDLMTDINKLKEHIYETVSSSLELLTFGMLYKVLKKQFKIERADFKNAVDELVAAGEIYYSYKHGCSFLEKSLEKPVQISKRIILVPYQMKYLKKYGDTVIKMQSGVSFGRGDHPTTRLALRGIEHAFELNSFIGNSDTDSKALDIGTGNGILAIACVLLGVQNALGIDIDKCAIKEAREHVIINGIANRIEISDMPVEKITGHFSIVTANLRYPTLKSLYPLIAKITEKKSMLVFSGIKVSECDELSKLYTKNLFTYCWEEREKDWSAILFKRF